MIGTTRYCLPLQCRTVAEVERQLNAHSYAYHWFEIWVDLLESCDPAWLRDVVAHWGERVIVLFRRPNLEPVRMSLAERCALMDVLAGTPAKVDFDWQTQQDDIREWKQRSDMSHVILSMHNYARTPPQTELEAVCREMAAECPWIAKFATMCNSREDAIRLLQLQQWSANVLEETKPLVLGMGEHGLVTRIFGTLWGNPIVFAPVTSSHASAPGQLTREEFAEIFALLEGEHT